MAYTPKRGGKQGPPRKIGRDDPSNSEESTANSDALSEPLDANDGGDTAVAPYGVGYGKPPEKHRFPPGRSGNPKGRPKTKKSLKTFILETLMAPVPITKGRKKKKVPAIVASLEVGLREAMGGSNAALRTVIGMLAMTGEMHADDRETTTLGKEAAEEQLRSYIQHRFGVQLPADRAGEDPE